MNKLIYSDNLDVLRDSIAVESVDIIFLDPAFKFGPTICGPEL